MLSPVGDKGRRRAPVRIGGPVSPFSSGIPGPLLDRFVRSTPIRLEAPPPLNVQMCAATGPHLQVRIDPGKDSEPPHARVVPAAARIESFPDRGRPARE
jgi:hypothetical protein